MSDEEKWESAQGQMALMLVEIARLDGSGLSGSPSPDLVRVRLPNGALYEVGPGRLQRLTTNAEPPLWEVMRGLVKSMGRLPTDVANRLEGGYRTRLIADLLQGAARLEAISKPPTLAEATKRLLQYEGHQVYCGHGRDASKPCVCGYNDALKAALEALEREEGK